MLRATTWINFTFCWAKQDTCTDECNVWFHLHDIQKQKIHSVALESEAMGIVTEWTPEWCYWSVVLVWTLVAWTFCSFCEVPCTITLWLMQFPTCFLKRKEKQWSMTILSLIYNEKSWGQSLLKYFKQKKNLFQ